MLSEDEMKVIERIEDTFYQDNGKGIKRFQKITLYEDGISDILKLLNIFEKLQKEIEHQKEKRENQKVELAILNEKQKEMNKLKNTVNSYYGMFKKQERQIKELQKENEIKIKGFENEELICSKFTEKVGKDIIDYKFEYENNQKIIDELQKEKEEKDKEIEKKDKIIYEMLGSFADIGFGFDYCNNDDRCINDCDKCLMKYFERKAKDGRN